MATTTTTSSVAMPSLLDLLAQPAAPASEGKRSAAFDALLQPPPHLPPGDTRQSRPHEDYRQEAESRRSPSPTRPAEQPQQEPPAQHSDVETDDEASLADDATVLADEIPGDDAAEAEDEIVAESLAGMVSCILPVPLPDEAGGEAAIMGEAIEPATAKRAGRSRAVATAEIGAVHTESAGEDQVANPTTAVVESDESVQPADAGLRGTLGEEIGRQPAIPTDDLQSIATTSEAESVSIIEPAVVAPVAAVGGADADARDSQSSDAEIATAATDRPTEQVLNAETVTTNSSAPTIGPVVATAAAVAEASAISNSQAAATGIGPAGTARGPRLPAEMLTPETSRAARGAATNIDATRLLGRVARAFAAVQQRDGEIQLRLSPPELGSLKLTIQMHDGGMVARLETETSAAKTALLDNLPALRERLAEQGVRIERFDVDLMQRQPGGMPDRPGDQQREAPPPPRAESPIRTRNELAAPPRAPLAASSSTTGLNVIV